MTAREAPPKPPQIDRQTTTPFHLKLFYRLNAYHHLSDFPVASSPSVSTSSNSNNPPAPAPASGPNSIQTRSRTSPHPPTPGSGSGPTTTSPQPLPPHLQIYTWQSCTLRELSLLLTSALPSLLPDPPVGTRLCFRLIYPDTRGAATLGPDVRGRFLSKDLGSVVVGASSNVNVSADGKEKENANENANANANANVNANGDGDGDVNDASKESNANAESGSNTATATATSLPRVQGDDANKTLHDARFVVGDYIDCAILPPLKDGSVAPPLSSNSGSRGGPSPAIGGGMRAFRENGLGSGGGGGRGSRGAGFGYGFGERPVPAGDWRRGDRLPDGGSGSGRGGRRGWAPY